MSDLTNYIQTYLGDTGDLLGWSGSGAEYEAIEDRTLEVYGVSTLAEATDLNKLHSIANMVAWNYVVSYFASRYNYSADGSSFQLSQLFDHANTMLAITTADAMSYVSNFAIAFGKWDDTEADPYSNVPYFERDL
jgi:hypothetical protein